MPSHSRPISFWRRMLAFILCILLVLPTLSGAAIQMGAYSMARLPAPHLENPMKVAKGVSSAGFCAGVGGVAFGTIAQAKDGSVVLDLMYDPEQADGSRLKAKIQKDAKTYVITISAYDWEVIPTALFAAGDQDAVFTYFGNLLDPVKEKELWEKGCQFINYHKDVDNTLIGLRLMQADLLAFHSSAPYNPTEDGTPIRGPGETLSTYEENVIKFHKIAAIYGGTGAQSYVISDVRDGVQFTTTPKGISFSGIPYWSCWKIDAEKSIKDYHESLDQTVKSNMLLSARLSVEGLFDTQPQTELEKTMQDKQIQQKYSEMVVKKYREAHFKRLLPESDRLTEAMRQEQGGNPPVYRALTKFMHLSALFRHLKERNAAAYTGFVNTVKNIDSLPPLETPTVLCPPASPKKEQIRDR